MKIYKEMIMLNEGRILLDNIEYNIVLGKHCIWIPDIESKFILSLNGRIESTMWQIGRNKELIDNHKFIAKNKKELLGSISNEYEILLLLSKVKMVPAVGDKIRVKKFTSSIFYPNYLDEKGLYGFQFTNAANLPKGKWNLDKFKQKFIDTGMIEASPGAMGDLEKENNVVNGYLIDIRRTIWDTIRLRG
jgi:hypothetical protein